MGADDVYLPIPVDLLLQVLPAVTDAYRQARTWAEPLTALHQAVSQSMPAEHSSVVLAALGDDPRWSSLYNTAAWRNDILTHLEGVRAEVAPYEVRLARRPSLDSVVGRQVR